MCVPNLPARQSQSKREEILEVEYSTVLVINTTKLEPCIINGTSKYCVGVKRLYMFQLNSRLFRIRTTSKSTAQIHEIRRNLSSTQMSIVPLMFRDWWEDFDRERPSRLLDQHFGLGLRRDDLLSSLNSYPTNNSIFRNSYFRPWRNNLCRQESASTIKFESDKFQVILDVQQFAPDEITVKTVNNSVIVEGKHEEKQDEHGFVSRQFTRRYVLPSDHDALDVISSLSSDGVLTITAPKKSLPPPGTERIVPIKQTGPSKSEGTKIETTQE